MCIEETDLLISGYCFRYLEEARDREHAYFKNCYSRSMVEVITRIFLVLTIPIVVAADLTLTAFAVATVIPICYLGTEFLCKTALTWVVLLPLTPLVMLSYLCFGRLLVGSFSAPPLAQISQELPEMGPDHYLSLKAWYGRPEVYRGNLDLLPEVEKPSDYPDTLLHRAIIFNHWRVAMQQIAGHDIQERFDITWGNQVISITLLEFIILSISPREGIYIVPDRQILINWLINELPTRPVHLNIPREVVDGFIVALLNVCNEEYCEVSGGNGVVAWKAFLNKMNYYNILLVCRALQGDLENVEPLFDEILRKGDERMESHSFSAQTGWLVCKEQLVALENNQSCHYGSYLIDLLEDRLRIPKEVAKMIVEYFKPSTTSFLDVNSL